jgi:hypothetical protein
MVDQVQADYDQEQRDKTFGLPVSVALAHGEAIGCKSIAKQILVHVSLPFDDPGWWRTGMTIRSRCVECDNTHHFGCHQSLRQICRHANSRVQPSPTDNDNA